MHNLYANIERILEVCKLYPKELTNNKGNMPSCGVIPMFSDPKVITQSLSKNWIFAKNKLELSFTSLLIPFNMNSNANNRG